MIKYYNDCNMMLAVIGDSAIIYLMYTDHPAKAGYVFTNQAAVDEVIENGHEISKETFELFFPKKDDDEEGEEVFSHYLTLVAQQGGVYLVSESLPNPN